MIQTNDSIENFYGILNKVEEKINDLEGDAEFYPVRGRKRGRKLT